MKQFFVFPHPDGSKSVVLQDNVPTARATALEDLEYPPWEQNPKYHYSAEAAVHYANLEVPRIIKELEYATQELKLLGRFKKD